MEIEELKETARRIRLATIRSIHAVGTGHAGGALSIVDLLAVLYFDEMRVRPEDPGWAERDRFILSKGHACASLYAALAERGYFPAEELCTLRQYGSRLQGHPDMKATPGLDMSSGSLGQGLSIGCGMALAAKMLGADYRVYVLLGDGELEEGQVWEAAMSARRYALDNMLAIVDANGLQINGTVDAVAGLQAEGDILGQGENREALEGFDGFLAEGPAIERGAGIHVLDVEDDAGRGEDRHERFPCRSGSGLSPEKVRAVGDISCHVRVTVSNS